mmetsp:Transcript_700/g.535  ORF Transcript_700/g.535 Transcript_700/m.535 type:complete len:176 (+) Transcript_700:370-897(+)
MSIPKKPAPAKLVISLFMKEKGVFETALNKLTKLFGPIDIISSWFNFDFTKYYYDEMGSPLFRRIIVFRNLIQQSDLAKIKLQTNAIEDLISERKKRRVNIDPGYMLCERFVLATGKNFSHRIYIGSRIYADLTLIFQKGKFKILEWTYPDYADTKMLNFLVTVRNKYMLDLIEN